jgi:hypothetical protein
MTSNRSRLAIVAAAIVLGACTTPSAGSSQPPVESGLTASSAPQATPTAAPATPAPSPSNIAAGGSAPPPNVDPCNLITRDEASGIVGVKLGAGVSSLVDKSRVCTFKSGITEVKLILAPEAPDAATAQAYWDAERSNVPAEVTVSDITATGFDRAAYGTASNAGFSISALFVIHGTWFFDLYCGLTACSETNSVGEGATIVTRLP